MLYGKESKMEKTETLFLPSDDLLKYCGSPLNREDSERIFSYASFAVKKMFRKLGKPYDKLKLSVFEGIFSGISSISEITSKKYSDHSREQQKKLMSCVTLDEICKGKPVFFYSISEENGRYRLLPPVRLSVQLEGDVAGFEKTAAKIKKSSESKRSYPLLTALLMKKRDDLLFKIGAAVMKTSVKELAFVTRFNEETFFKNVPMKPFENGRLNISDKETSGAFAALYAMTFYDLSFRDIYTVDEVFGFSETGIRSKDTAKREATMRLSDELEKADDNTIAAVLKKMGETLLKIPLPEIDTKNFVTSAENYVYYNAVSNMGTAYIKAAAYGSGNDGDIFARALKRAVLLEDHKFAALLCEETAALAEKGKHGISRSRSRKKAAEVRKRAEKEKADEQKMQSMSEGM